MPLLYFIEIDDNYGQATPFNLLPVEFAKRDFALEIAAFLPSSSIDLSFGWTRPRNLLGFTPLLNFFSKKDVGNLLKHSGLEKSPKIFMVWKDFSIELITKFSSKKGPSVVFTSNEKIASYFHSNPCVYCVLYSEEESRDQIYRRCLNELLKMFTDMHATAFNKETVTTDFKDGYSLQKSFLFETRTNGNLLCKSNEIVLAQTRGKIPRIIEKKDYFPRDTEKCYSDNVQMAEEILAERFIDILLDGRGEELRLNLEKIPSLANSIENYLKNFQLLSTRMKKEKYLELKKIASSFLKDVPRSEINLFIPSVNPLCKEQLISEMEKDLETGLKDQLKYVVDRVLVGGRRVYVDVNALDIKIVKIADELCNTRLRENTFATNLVGLLASRKLSPVLKTVTAPSRFFEELHSLRQFVGSPIFRSEDNMPLCRMNIGERFNLLKTKLGKFIPQTYITTIQSIQPSYITIISDLPFEIAQINNGPTTICQEFPTTRIPITPMRSMLYQYNKISQRVFYGNHLKTLENILVLNTLHETDELYDEFRILIRHAIMLVWMLPEKPFIVKTNFLKL